MEQTNKPLVALLHQIQIHEQSFIKDLENTINNFMNPLYAASLEKKAYITYQDVKSLFLNIEEVLQVHQNLLAALTCILESDIHIDDKILIEFWESQVQESQYYPI